MQPYAVPVPGSVPAVVQHESWKQRACRTRWTQVLYDLSGARIHWLVCAHIRPTHLQVAPLSSDTLLHRHGLTSKQCPPVHSIGRKYQGKLSESREQCYAWELHNIQYLVVLLVLQDIRRQLMASNPSESSNHQLIMELVHKCLDLDVDRLQRSNSAGPSDKEDFLAPCLWQVVFLSFPMI